MTRNALRERLHTIVFEADTPAGRGFDVALLVAISLSVLVVMLDSVSEYHVRFGSWFLACEWLFTLLFTLEYLLRRWIVQRPLAYACSFFGIVDLLSIVPSYLSLLFGGAQLLIVIRSLRLLRAFRVLKLAHLLGEASVLSAALRASRSKIFVFLGGVVPALHLLAIVTITTVGYGDIHPHTPLGQVLASVAMILGYGIIAVPTGIVGVELAEAARRQISQQACPSCGKQGHVPAARFCMHCGAAL